MHKVPSIFEEPCAEMILWEDSAVMKSMHVHEHDSGSLDNQQNSSI
jgi:hypothetical protein